MQDVLDRAARRQTAGVRLLQAGFHNRSLYEALAVKCPAELYTASPRPYDGLPELEYPFHDRDILVTACGRICLHRKKINTSTVLAGQKLGIKEVDVARRLHAL